MRRVEPRLRDDHPAGLPLPCPPRGSNRLDLSKRSAASLGSSEPRRRQWHHRSRRRPMMLKVPSRNRSAAAQR